MARREYAGNAAATTLNGAITAGSSEIQITDATNWPTGSVGPFVVIIDRGEAAEEKVLITSRTGTTLFVNSRGFDSTTAASHADGATIEHGLSATDIDEVNDHVFDTSNDDHTQYLNNARHDVEARHTFTAGLGTPAAPADITGETHTASAGSGDNPAREDHIHAWDDAGWEEWEPTLSNLTIGSGTVVAKFSRIGRMIFWRLHITLAADSSVSGSVSFSLPVTVASDYPNVHNIGKAELENTGGSQSFMGAVRASTTTTGLVLSENGAANGQLAVLSGSAPFTWGTGDILTADGFYEAAAGSS